MVYVKLLLRKGTRIILVLLDMRKIETEQTELSNYIWALKKDKVAPSIKWKIIRIVRGKPTSLECFKRYEMFRKCVMYDSIGFEG